MKIGAVFPQTEIEADAGAVKEYALAVERMGFTHILAYDHVVGANTASRPDWKGPYKLESRFQEPLVLFSYLAGATSRIEFATGILILPQRQTVLVAKQAACLDVLSGGRLRLAVGTGWNEVEYEALGASFQDRGKRYEEQIGMLRLLWTTDAVTVKTDYHAITDAGINPLPARPIPLWMGGGTMRIKKGQPVPEGVLRRIARLADGWMADWQPDSRGMEHLARFHGYCREYGRDPKSIGIEGRISVPAAGQSSWADAVQAWRDIGASHLSIDTMGEGLRGAEQHLRRLEALRKAASLD